MKLTKNKRIIKNDSKMAKRLFQSKNCENNFLNNEIGQTSEGWLKMMTNDLCTKNDTNDKKKYIKNYNGY